MSELKSFIVLYDGKFIRAYKEKEADKVIADLEKKLDLYKRGFKEDDKTIAYLYAELRRYKYKRCLAMAKWCRARYNEWVAYYPTTTTRKMRFLDKWEKRWLKLAEHFKPEAR